MPSYLELSGGYGLSIQPATGSGLLGIVNQALLELKLPEVMAVFGNTGTDVSLLRALCSRVGDLLLKAHNWPQLEQVGTITTVAGTATYQLPHDVYQILHGTMWDATNKQRVYGPDSPQNDRARQDGLYAQISLNRIYRKLGQLVQLYPTPTTTGDSIKFAYTSSNYVLQNGLTPSRYITTDADEVLFDKWLFVSWLKVEFLKSNGFDAEIDLLKANTLLQEAISAGGASGAINLGRASRTDGLLMWEDIPEAGYG